MSDVFDNVTCDNCVDPGINQLHDMLVFAEKEDKWELES